MSQDTTPQVILDPGECISASGDLRGPILSRLRSACAPVPISDLLANHHADRHQAVRDTLRDLEYFGAVRIDGKSVTALHGNGKPYTRIERRETARVMQCVTTPGVDKGPGNFELPKMADGSARVASQRNATRSGHLPQIIADIRNGATIKDAFLRAGIKSPQYVREFKPEEWAQVKEAQDEVIRETMEASRKAAARLRLAILDHLRASGGDTLDGIISRGIALGSPKKRTYNMLKAMRVAGDVHCDYVTRRIVHWVARLRN